MSAPNNWQGGMGRAIGPRRTPNAALRAVLACWGGLDELDGARRLLVSLGQSHCLEGDGGSEQAPPNPQDRNDNQ